MNIPFMNRTHAPEAEASTMLMWRRPKNHQIESAFATSRCRFTLDCSCGVHFDTPYIDEALEWRELHETLAPLADKMTP
jgi:hypothetical protein